MSRPAISATELLSENASKRPHEFPGAKDQAANANKYVEALSLLKRTCEPHYESAAQASLMNDIKALTDEIESTVKKNTHSDGRILSDTILIELREALYSKLRYLNGHGPAHVKAVDNRACSLIREFGIDLSPYELFFLCAGLTIHDAGLIFGRDGHESSIHKILSALGNVLASKRERDAIERIASAHGGHVPGDKSNKATIDLINAREQVEGRDIRPQLIAAIVRLADELAEDHTRYSPISGESRAERKARLMGSEMFHVYSQCLEPCMIRGKERAICLQFLLDVEDVVTTFHKGTQECFILEEIYERTEKCLAEVLYCGRFMQESSRASTTLVANEVRVSIEIASDSDGFEPLTLKFALKAKGYPDVSSFGRPSFGSELKASLLEYADNRGIPQFEAQQLLTDAPNGAAVAKLFKRLGTPLMDPTTSGATAEVKPQKWLTKLLKRGPNV